MITINPVRNYNPTFCAFRNTVKDKHGILLYRGDTGLFRSDIDFNELIRFLNKKYVNVPKVNLIAHACSDGEEIFSVISKMIDLLGEEGTKKFLPVIARDIDKNHIEQAISGEYRIESFERGGINFYLGKNFTKYFEPLNEKDVRVRDNLRQMVKFSAGDIMEDVHKIDFNNTVLLARNFWPYLDMEDIDKLAMNLSHKMNMSSTLVIGDYDKEYNIDRILKRYGFKENLFADNVFEKLS